MSALSAFDKERGDVVLLAEVTVGLDLRAWKDWALPFNNARYTVVPGVTKGAYSVVEVLEDGSPMSLAAGPIGVHTTSGSYWMDRSTGILYAQESSGDIHDKVILPRIKLAFSDRNRTYNDRLYEGRIESIPTITQRIEPMFGGVVMNGGGSLVLINADGFFDGFYEGYGQGDMGGFLWENAEVILKYGVDSDGTQMDVGSFRTLGTWRVSKATLRDGKLALELEDVKARLRKALPADVYSRTDYPKIRESDIGEAIPLAYGVCRGAKPALIDPGARKFKVAGHAIHSFKEVRVQDGETDRWNVVAFESQDAANGEFTLAEADWENDRPVSVDFVGKAHADGYPMVNAADVIEDILSEIGETDIASADFVSAEAVLDLGPNNHNERTVEMPINLLVNTDTEAGEIIGDIAKTAGLYVTTTTSGQWTVTVFQPQQGEGLTRISEDDTLTFSEERVADDPVSKVTVEYSRNEEEDRSQSVTVERTRTQYQYGSSVGYRGTERPLLERIGMARHWGGRFLMLDGRPQTYFKMRLPAKFMNLKPGDFVWLVDTKRGRDEVLEVLTTKINLDRESTIEVNCGMLRGYARHAGYWMDTGDTVPARMGGGTVDWPFAGTTELFAWLPQNVGHWADDSGKVDDVTFEESRWV